MGKKIEITEENYEMYREFYVLKAMFGIIGIRKKYGKLCSAGMAIVTILSLFLLFLLVVTEMPTISILLFYAIYILGNIGVWRITNILSLKDFKKDYPDFDMNIDLKELKKELEKHKELSKVSKDFEERKEEHLENIENKFREMSPEEKLAFLEQEKEFWEQELIQQKYSNADVEEKGREKRLDY